jgi:endonuclease/exonuclease/phosphatase family metal-dependent hydrolase
LKQNAIIGEWVRAWVERTGDPDVILRGDFNTMGGREIGPTEELGLADELLFAANLRRLPNETGCSQYWDGPGERDGIFRPSLLDHVFLGGLKATAPARSWLHCERLQCGELVSRIGQEDGTFFDVSDHCPVTFEVELGATP